MIKTIKKYKVVTATLFLVVGVLVLTVFRNHQTYTLEVSVLPPEATTMVAGQFLEGSFSIKLPRGEYVLTTSMPGHTTKTTKVTLEANTKIAINLTFVTPSSAVDLPDMAPFEISSVSFGSGILAIDRSSQHLVEIGERKRTLYNRPITHFSSHGDRIAVVDQEQHDLIIILSYPAATIIGTITTPDIVDIGSVSINTDTNSVYWLANYDLGSATSSLFRSRIDSGQGVQVMITTATQIEALEGDRVALFTYGEAPDQGRLEIVDAETMKVVFKTNSDDIVVSPSRDKILTTDSRMVKVTRSSGEIIYSAPHLFRITDYAFLDDATLVIMNVEESQLFTLEIANNELRQVSMPQKYSGVQFEQLLGSAGGAIFVADRSGNVLAIKPQ